MGTLGIILIGTGILVFFSGFTIRRSAKKMTQSQSRYEAMLLDEKRLEEDRKTEEEYHSMVTKGMRILHAVGITCILVGILFIIFGG